ncbi:hypothetical protein HOG11_03635, partial [bacterium]|nr:hypothetical protein [bacterium]
KNVIDAFKKGEVEGRAFFFINYYQEGDKIRNNIKFYLTTNNKIANFYVENQAKKKAKKILNSVIQTFKLVGNK